MADDVRIKPQVYKDPRPAETFDRYHARVRRRPPEWPYELVRAITVWIAVVFFRAQAYGAENVPNGPADHRAQPRLVHGPLLRGGVRPPPHPVHGEVADVRAPPDELGLQPRRRVPGAPRLRRRGDLQDRVHDPPSRRHDRDVRRGRPLAQRVRRRGSQGWDRAPGARVRRRRGACRDPRLSPGAQLEAAAFPEDRRALRQADSVRANRRSDARAAAGMRR